MASTVSLTLRALTVDATAVAVIRELDAIGVRSLLLKGASLEQVLYDADEPRLSTDVDLLVAPADHQRAERCLKHVGYVNKYDGPSPVWAEEHADAWAASDWRVPVDLHRRLWGVEISAELAWHILWARRQKVELGASSVQALSASGIALLVALHAAHHGPDVARPLVDLNRALQRLNTTTWEQALTLAEELQAAPGLAAGLGLVDAGERLRDRLGLAPADRDVVVRVAAMWTAPPTAAGFLRLFDAESPRETMVLLLRELFPSREFLRHANSPARRPRGRLLRGYAVRWRDLMSSAPTGWRAARAIRRSDERQRLETVSNREPQKP